MAHHSFSQGRPKGLLFQSLSTRNIAPAERYDFWATEVVRNFSVSTPDAWQRKNFLANVTSLATATSELHYAETEEFDAYLTTHTISNLVADELSLILLLNGRIEYTYGVDGARALAGEGFFLLDGTRTTALRFSRSSFIQIDLSRPLLESLFPCAMPSPAFINAALARSPLAGLLRDHLRRFPASVAAMPPREQRALLDVSESFALATIEAACSATHSAAEPLGPGLFAAAQSYIRRHLNRPDLSPDSVAAALGCSRATLYRLFADREWTVQGYIRELRLQNFLHLLRTEDKAVHVRVLAQRCGLYDSSNVGRMFRRRFGASPSEARSTPDHR